MSFCFPSSFIFSRKAVSPLFHMPSSQILTSLTANVLVSNDIKKVNHLSPHFFTFFQSLETPLFIFPFPFIFIIIKITIPSIVFGSKKLLFSTTSLVKLLSDSSISQSHSKLQFKSTNHIQSCSFNQLIIFKVVVLINQSQPWFQFNHHGNRATLNNLSLLCESFKCKLSD